MPGNRISSGVDRSQRVTPPPVPPDAFSANHSPPFRNPNGQKSTAESDRPRSATGSPDGLSTVRLAAYLP
ncbi:hypothetical protein K227x_47490 [Rubripirellula lacrimiformis]|uniref:Uncharacterized protein n=1 Tax=Rubripirellula lacrimiformis TaxID=1930273 RepID=A0A517NGT1_9BACT|nr:hypothetical protein K227x_47490 [Rubripirellula lacrimiformis]